MWNTLTDINGIHHYEYQIDYGNWISTGTSTSFTTPAQLEGIHTIYVRAVDNPGNLGNIGNVSIYIDNPNPNTPIIREWHMGTNWTEHNTPYYSWTDPGDIGSGITNYVAELDTTIIQLSNNQTYHTNNLSSGSHTFKIYSQDALYHNSSWSNNITVYVDTTKPENVSINSSTHYNSSQYYNITIPVFNFTTTDAHSGLYGYYYVVDTNSSTTPDIMNQWTNQSTVNITGISGTGSLNNLTINITGLGRRNMVYARQSKRPSRKHRRHNTLPIQNKYNNRNKSKRELSKKLNRTRNKQFKYC